MSMRSSRQLCAFSCPPVWKPTSSFLPSGVAQNLKGIEGPVRAWAALRSSSVESRFEAFHGTGLTELVGRAEELEILLRRWSKSKSGEGQVVLLSGVQVSTDSRAPGTSRYGATHALTLFLLAAAHR
jgi:hypothetical protein